MPILPSDLCTGTRLIAVVTPRGRTLQMVTFPVRTAVALGAFALASALAELFGASSLGIALTFGQIAFALTASYLLIRV
jgi:hypothetical protein